MMMQEKAFGSLTGSLLARKGGARPAMRPQAYRFDAGDPSAADDDCGWNDMGGAEAMSADMLTPEQRASLLPSEKVTGIVAPADTASASFSAAASMSPARRQQWDLVAGLSATPQMSEGVWEAEAGARLAADDRAEQDAFLARLRAESNESNPQEEERDALAPKMRAVPGMNAKSAFTLRLDKQRHLKLRLACAFSHTSAQRLLTEALDEYLERHHSDLPA